MKDNIRIYGVKDSYIKYLSQYQEQPKGQLIELNINAEKNPHYKFLFTG